MKVNIKPETLKALLIVAAKSDIRYYLNGILLDVTPIATTLVATDGHRLLAVLVPDDDVTDAVPGEYIIPRDVIESVKPCKAGRNSFPLELTIQGGRFTLTGVTTATGALVDGRFPDWRRVMPATATGETAQFNGHYMADFHTVAGLLTDSKTPMAPIVHHNGTGSALVTRLGENALGVIMPVRYDDVDMAHPGLPAWARRANNEVKAAA